MGNVRDTYLSLEEKQRKENLLPSWAVTAQQCSGQQLQQEQPPSESQDITPGQGGEAALRFRGLTWKLNSRDHSASLQALEGGLESDVKVENVKSRAPEWVKGNQGFKQDKLKQFKLSYVGYLI